ncbi:protein rep [Paraburkholderia agricolaris]|uniref:protein rep n=1 Tax=Paraburkholderia agricolaris TaxID=2152888 RepID=UPI0038B6ED54
MSNIKQVLSILPFLNREGGKRESLALQDVMGEIFPGSREAACMRHRLQAPSVPVGVTERGNTHVGHLMVCDAAHICPVCHGRKLAKDQRIVSRIVHDHYQAGGILVDTGLTVPHHIHEPLSSVRKRLEAVWKRLLSKRIWKELTRTLGIVGFIRRLEITLGPNGWHPHYHVSFLCNPAHATDIKGHSWKTALDDAFSIVWGSWRQAGEDAGIAVAEQAQAAVAIIGHLDAQKAVSYNLKNMGYCRKPESLTPIDLLRVVAQINDAATVYYAKKLFTEYAKATKGKHILSYGGTARAARRVAVEQAEEDCAELVQERLGYVSPEAWRAIVKTGLRPVFTTTVKSRRELVAIVLRAALGTGHGNIPVGWMRLCFEAETKTVISIKAPVPAS